MKRQTSSESARRDRRAAQSPEAGFTLVELLLAITILSMVVVSIYSSFSLGAHLRNRSRDRMTELQQMRELISTLRDDLHNLASVDPNLTFPAEGGLVLVRHAGATAAAESGSLRQVVFEPATGEGPTIAIVRRETTTPRGTAATSGDSLAKEPADTRTERRFDGIAALRIDPLRVDDGGLVDATTADPVDAVRIHVTTQDSAFALPDPVIWVLRPEAGE